MHADNVLANSEAHARKFALALLHYKTTALVLLLERKSVVSRLPSIVHQRLQWEGIRIRFGDRSDFKRHLRMSYESYSKLLELLRPHLNVDNKMALLRGGAIIPEVRLYITLRYCAGGSYSDLAMFAGISFASFFRCMWMTIKAINSTGALDMYFPQSIDEASKAARGFESISRHQAISNCVAVVDGYHLQTHTPSRTEVDNVRSYYSGHYQTYGVNIQAACDHNCRFIFIGVAGPGVMGDRDALNQVSIGQMIENLPGLFCVIGDCAYKRPTEHPTERRS
jgi:hypothetical protein